MPKHMAHSIKSINIKFLFASLTKTAAKVVKNTIILIITHVFFNKKGKCINIHLPYSYLSTDFQSDELISAIYPNTSSLPNPFSDDVMNTGGNSSHSSSSFAL